MRPVVALILIPLVLGACANTGLRNLRNDGNGPDEFMVQPAKPLQAPANYTALPPPTPGQANLTDRYPLQEGVTAFGGTPQSADAPIPASDGALVQYAGRRGVDPAIRQTLAVQDAEFRQRKSRFTQFRIIRDDLYDEAYKREALDAHREQRKWRRAGARTPSAPPE